MTDFCNLDTGIIKWIGLYEIGGSLWINTREHALKSLNYPFVTKNKNEVIHSQPYSN